MKPTLNEQLARMQKLAGIITENQITETTGVKIVDDTIEKLKNLKSTDPSNAQKELKAVLTYISNYGTRNEGSAAETVYNKVKTILTALEGGKDMKVAIDMTIANLLNFEDDINEGSNTNLLDFSSWKRIMGDDNIYAMIPPSKKAEEGLDIWVYPAKNKVMIASNDDNMIQTIADKYNSEVYQEMAPSIYQVNLKLADLASLFPGQDFFLDDMNEGYDEFKRADKGSKGVTAKNKGEEKVYGAGVEKGEKIEKKKMTKEKLKAQIKEMILAELNEDSDKDINITNDSSDYNFYESKIAEAEGDMQNLKFNWLIKDEDFYKYDEKGVADGLDVKDGKKVKEIVGYFEDEDGDEDFDVIAYISSDGDIVDDDDILYDFWYKELNKKLADLARKGMEGNYEENDDEYEAEDDSSADSLYKMFVKYDLDNDRRYYDVEDLMDAYPNLSKKEAKKLKDKLQNPLDEANSNKVILNGKEVDVNSIEVEGGSYNDYSDVYISVAKFKDGTDLNNDQREELEGLVDMGKLANDSLNEAKKDEEVEDVTVDDTEVVAAPEADMMAGETAEVSGIQSNLQAAYAEAKVLGDEKLITQIANTITYFTKAHILDTAPVNENMFPMLKRILR